ncbi:hypothetical protein ANN_26251 [Periplaneta americana]|uniref:Uncharacterized protein n=1 Tax=Periplaneta americana TaxID=6978 RepID=A0ABQ8S5S2_PERAM|nr:hypothetical protein ANN_26251 [Periplaneta americana]
MTCPQRTPVADAAVREAVAAEPHTGTRAVARNLLLNHMIVHRILKLPFKRHTTHAGNIGYQDLLTRILWADEYTFRSEGNINRRNEHRYVDINPSIM